jgi:hypothetical protein
MAEASDQEMRVTVLRWIGVRDSSILKQKGHAQIIAELPHQFEIAPYDALIYALMDEHAESEGGHPSDEQVIILRRAVDAGEDCSDLHPFADRLMNEGVPLGQYLTHWLAGMREDSEAACAELKAIGEELGFRKYGGLGWVARKVQVGSWVQYRGLPFRVSQDIWTDPESRPKRKQVIVHSPFRSETQVMVHSPFRSETPPYTPECKSLPKVTPCHQKSGRMSGLNPYKTGPQGDRLASLEASRRDRANRPKPKSD